MKKTVLSIFLLLVIVSVNAQEPSNDMIKFWIKKGNISLLFNQTAYNNNGWAVELLILPEILA